MNQIKLLSAKLHRTIVTDTHKDYIGSISVDQSLMDAIGMLPLEEVEIVNVSNGNRWTTYVLPTEKESGKICPNGGGAYLCQKGDVLIIFSYVYKNRDDVFLDGHEAKVLVAGPNNQAEKVFSQKIIPDGNGYSFLNPLQ
jgi:aspartate 1-decarboxylase